MLKCIIIFVIYLTQVCLGGLRKGITYKDKYQTGEVILAYDNVGPQMCGLRCLHQDSCVAINYSTNNLTCELLKPGGSLISRTGSMYSDITDWSMVSLYY